MDTRLPLRPDDSVPDDLANVEATVVRVLFSNPASTGREKMTVRISRDDGKTWPTSRAIYTPSSAYSCLTELPGGHAGLLFERDGYKKITFVDLPMSWLEQ